MIRIGIKSGATPKQVAKLNDVVLKAVVTTLSGMSDEEQKGIVGDDLMSFINNGYQMSITQDVTLYNAYKRLGVQGMVKGLSKKEYFNHLEKKNKHPKTLYIQHEALVTPIVSVISKYCKQEELTLVIY